MNDDTFCPTISATGQCRGPWQMPLLCKERISLPLVHSFLLKMNWQFLFGGSVELRALQCEWFQMQPIRAMVQCIHAQVLFRHDMWGTCFLFSMMTVNMTCRICVRMPWLQHFWVRELPCTLGTRPHRLRVQRQVYFADIAWRSILDVVGWNKRELMFQFLS